MGMLDGILGGLLGGNSNAGPLQSILGQILMGGGGGSGGGLGGMLGGMLGGGQPHAQPQAQPQASSGGMGGLGDLLSRFQQAGHGDVAQSWVSNGPNKTIDPGALEQVFGRHQVDQWSQQTGMPQGDILSQLSNLLPHAIDRMTPNGQVPAGASPFDEGGVELPRA